MAARAYYLLENRVARAYPRGIEARAEAAVPRKILADNPNRLFREG